MEGGFPVSSHRSDFDAVDGGKPRIQSSDSLENTASGIHASSKQRQTSPLSLAQQQFWILHHENPSAVHHVTARLSLRGKLDRKVLRAALDQIVARHEVLRTTYRCVDGEAVQVVRAAQGFSLREEDVDGHRTMDQISRQEEIEAFDLSVDPLIRGRLLRLSVREHVLLITQHPIVGDRRSIGVLSRELRALYSAFASGRGDPLSPCEFQYRDYATWQRQCVTEDVCNVQIGYWIQTLSAAPSLVQLPTDRHRQASQPFYLEERVPFRLSPTLTKRLRTLARQQGVSLLTTLTGSWAILLGRWSNQTEVVIGTRAWHRERPEFRASIGPFENTVALRIALQDRPTVEQLLKRVKATVTEAQSHSDVPFQQVIAALTSARAHFRTLQVLIELNETWGGTELQLPELTLCEEPLGTARTPFELMLSVNDANGHLSGKLQYASELFDRETVERMMASWQVVLKAMVKHVRRPIDRVAMLPAAERARVLYRFNDSVTTPRDRLIQELFEEQVERTPDATALTYEGKSLTYLQLNRKANRLARSLRNKGVGPDRLVGICVERGLEMVVGLLGILKAGGAYLPLDPNYPAERLQHMLEDAAPQVVLTQENLMAMLPVIQADVIVLDGKRMKIPASIDENLLAEELGLSAQYPVYVIYTSGSTGLPKGTAMAHRSMVNLIEWHRRQFPASEGKRVLQFAALSFDVAFQEIFSTLCTGGVLVMLDEWVRKDVRALMELLSSEAIERLFVPPLMLQSLAEYSKSDGAVPGNLQDVITAGEQLRISPEITNLFKRLNGCRLHNHYGPTETHVVTALTLSGDPDQWPARPTIGAPISNARLYVLDPWRQPVPVGVVGELWIGGAGLALGYLHRPDLTAERFVADTFATQCVGRDPQPRMYRTGDLGRWRADGTIEYLGRNDDQVKIRGFRVEIGEIEVRLAKHPDVRDAAVVLREDGLIGSASASDARQLVAYVTLRTEAASSEAHARTGASAPSVNLEALRTHLAAVLPQYMVPSAFVVLERLPLTPNGKLDRRALPAPGSDAYVRSAYEAPQGSLETRLAALWQGLLGIERVSREDNFFALGGHSLLIVQMMMQLRQQGLSADVRCFFESGSLAALAAALTSDVGEFVVPPNGIPSGCTVITPEMLPLVELTGAHLERIVQTVPGGAANIQDIYPLAPLQEGILFHHLLNERAGDTYVLPILLSLDSRDRLDCFIRALQKVIDRHDVLRTAVLWEHLPHPVQVVHRAANLPVKDIALDPARDAIEQLEERMSPERLRLDVRRAPLMHLQVAADPRSTRWYALLQLHHLTCDHEALDTLLAEVVAHMEECEQALPAPVPYRQHVARALAYEHSHDAGAFFRSKLGDVEEPTAPFGLSDVYGDAGRIEIARQPLEPTLAQRVRAESQHHGVSAATLFHAIWALVLARTCGRSDIVYGSLLSGRLQGSTDGKHALGMFINTLPLRLRLENVTAEALVQQTHQELAELLNHEYASLAEAQRSSSMTGTTPLFSTLLNYLHATPHADAEHGELAAGVQLLTISEWTNYPIVLVVEDQGAGFALTAQTDRRIDPYQVLAYVSTATASFIEALENAPQSRALALPVIPEHERRLLIETFNATDRPYPNEQRIEQLFEAQVRRTPDALAVIVDDERLSYADLDARANRLACELKDRGLQRGECLPIVMPRSLRQAIVQLAVLKCGGVYVPIDPDFPAERQAFIIRDCGARLLIAERETSGSEAGNVVRWADCVSIKGVLGRLETNIPERATLAPSAAYVMYTSGSTGRPKGVIVPHRAVVRLVVNNGYARIESTDCLAYCSNPAFDASTFEIWGALLNGARLLIVPRSVVLEPERFAAVLTQHDVTVLFLTVGLFGQYLEPLAPVFARLKCLMTGGDIVEPGMLRQVLERSPPQHLLNAYGPTECTTFTTTYRVEAVGQEENSVSIGRPISNTRVYILDGQLQPVPVGVPGELYIGGAGVAYGYLNRPELTAERFISDPFSSDPQARLYRSGDIGRWRADGNIEFIGRKDYQVKIRGFRIELGEIEAQLARHPQVREVVVIARVEARDAQSNAPMEKRLVAYIVPNSTDAPSIEALRAYMEEALPEYMIPSAFVVLATFPLTANGKIDRRALPAPDFDAYATREYEPPQGEIEELLAGIWQKLLKVERVGRHDNFFELGGHSLLATKVVVRIRASLSIEMPIRLLFEHPTIAQLAERVEELRQAHLLEEIERGGDEMDALLASLASMPESQARELVRGLRKESHE